jgi:hypothetical protein
MKRKGMIGTLRNSFSGISTQKELKKKNLPNRGVNVLYTARWSNQEDFSKGFHDLTVEVTLKTGQKVTKNHRFSLDGTSSKFSFFPRLILMMDWDDFCQKTFVFINVNILLFLISVRLLTSTARVNGSLKKMNWVSRKVLGFSRKFMMLTMMNNLMMPILFALLYQLFLLQRGSEYQ